MQVYFLYVCFTCAASSEEDEEVNLGRIFVEQLDDYACIFIDPETDRMTDRQTD